MSLFSSVADAELISIPILEADEEQLAKELKETDASLAECLAVLDEHHDPPDQDVSYAKGVFAGWWSW